MKAKQIRILKYYSLNTFGSSFITDATQHLQYTCTELVEYVPFGEDLVRSLSGVEGHEQNTAAYLSPYTFSGKERDVEMRSIREDLQKASTTEQTNLSYFGARYYDASLSIWLSVDPLSDKYPSLSAYNYCALNPVMLVDPDGRDIFEVDQTGNVVNRIADQSQDVVRVLGEDGKPIDNGKAFAYGTIEQVNVGNDNVSVLSVKGDANGETVFEYLADNLSIEFGLTQTGSAGDDAINYVSTGCKERSEPGSLALMKHLSPSTNVRRHVHNHPDNILIPSGIGIGNKDIGFAGFVESKFKSSCVSFQLYGHFYGDYVNYHSGSQLEHFQIIVTFPVIEVKD